MTGGWAAKELTEKGLKTLVLERGPMVRHIADYPTAHEDPWETQYPRGRLPPTRSKAHYPVQQRTGYALTEYTQHFFVERRREPYTETKRFDWIRGYHVGGRSLLWGRQSYRQSRPGLRGQRARTASASTGRSAMPTSRPGTTTSSASSASAASAKGLPQLPDGMFQPPMEMNCVETRPARRRSRSKFQRPADHHRPRRPPDRADSRTARSRGTCQYRNMCIRGCPFGAYFSSNSATLAAAEAHRQHDDAPELHRHRADL